MGTATGNVYILVPPGPRIGNLRVHIDENRIPVCHYFIRVLLDTNNLIGRERCIDQKIKACAFLLDMTTNGVIDQLGANG